MNQAKPICASLLLALGAVPALAQYQLNPLWSISPGQRTYVSSGDLQNGLAYNPVTDSVLIVNRSGGLSVNRVAAATGANLGTLNVTGITGGLAALNKIDVADDGNIYAVNLTSDSTASAFKIYRWTSESAAPTTIYSGDVSGGDASLVNRRFGDNFAVRGSGANTQFVVASRSGTFIHVFTTTDGNTFTPTKIQTDITAGDFGLAVAFGEGDTVWGSASGRGVRNVGFNLATQFAGTHGDFSNAVIPTTVSVIGINPNGMLAGIQLNPSPTRDAFLLYQVWGDTAVGANDTDQFPADNANGNGTGAVDWDKANGRVFALDSNNGIVGMTIVAPEPSTYALGLLGLGALMVHARRRSKK